MIVLAVKPQIMPLVLTDLNGRVRREQLVLSIAAGITIDTIQETLGADQAVIRSMPNTPALVGRGITGVVAGDPCSEIQKEQADRNTLGRR